MTAAVRLALLALGAWVSWQAFEHAPDRPHGTWRALGLLLAGFALTMLALTRD